MKAIILGGSGFVGGHLVERLVGRGYEVAIIDIKDPDNFEFSGKVYRTNVLDFGGLEKNIVEFEPDVVFESSGVLGTAETFAHIADTVDVNIKGSIHALEIARKHNCALVYIGLTNKWLNPYTITKRAGERFCLMFAREFNMKAAVIKGLNAYGPRQRWRKVRKIAPTFITLALKDQPIIINGSGNQVVDMIHTDDLSEILIRTFEMGTCWGKSIDAGTGIPMTVNEVAERIVEMVGSESRIIHVPMRRGEPEISVTLADPAPARQLLDFYPQVTFEEGMRQTIEWYRENA